MKEAHELGHTKFCQKCRTDMDEEVSNIMATLHHEPFSADDEPYAIYTLLVHRCPKCYDTVRKLEVGTLVANGAANAREYRKKHPKQKYHLLITRTN